MGTRNLTCVVLDGEYKVAQYGQWDGYPEGQGATALRFLRKLNTPEKFKRFTDKVRACSWITNEEQENRDKKAGITHGTQWISMDKSDQPLKLYPENHRDTGAEILDLVYKSKQPLKLVNEVDFAQDGLFCE